MLVQGGGLAAVFGVIAVCISFLLSLFSGKEGEMIEEGAAAGQMDMGLSEAAATPAWLDVLIKITEYLMAALTIALICFLLYRLVLAAVKKFYEKGIVQDEDCLLYTSYGRAYCCGGSSVS